MNDEDKQLMQVLDDIADRSKRGAIEWTQPAPSMFQWSLPLISGNLLATIQRAKIPRRQGLLTFSVDGETESSFLFQIVNKASNDTILALSSAERPEFRNALAAIYKGAEQGADVRAGQILRSILGA